MDRTTATLGRLRRFAPAMDPTTVAVDAALPAVRALLDTAGIPYRFVGGIAVVHHGYARTTDAIDVLVDGSDLAALDAKLAAFDFAKKSRSRLRHTPSGVRIDLVIGGDPSPRLGEPPYPSPTALAPSRAEAARAPASGSCGTSGASAANARSSAISIPRRDAASTRPETSTARPTRWPLSTTRPPAGRARRRRGPPGRFVDLPRRSRRPTRRRGEPFHSPRGTTRPPLDPSRQPGV